MANKADKEDIIRQGKELWKALKSDPVDKKRILKLLESGAPANFREPGRGKTERTPLHFVVSDRNGDEELMDMLLKHGAQTNLGDCYDLTPLHVAAEKGYLEIVKKLLNNPDSPADNTKLSRASETPLEVAERLKHDEVVGFLRNERGDEHVSPDGPPDVLIPASPGSTYYIDIKTATNVMTGDQNTMHYSDKK